MADVESIVFIGKHIGLIELSKWQQKFVQYLGVDLPITFIREPTEVEELLVPGQGFGLGDIARGTPEFRAFLGKLRENVEPRGAEKVYISRTRTGKKGSVLNEVSIERNLVDQGYTAFHPQNHSLEEQLAQYLAATHIIGLDSSAFHLLGLVARPEQRIAVILRRNMMAYYNIQLQLEGMCGHKPDIINVLTGDWMPPSQKKASRLSWGQVDHERLVSELSQRGYIDRPEDWSFPTEKGLLIAFENYKKRMGGNVVFRPVEIPIDEAINRKHSA